jgi:ABC-type transport system substrate-binding protein
MAIRPRPSNVTHDVTRLTRREILKAGGLALGALSVGTPAFGRTPRSGGTLISAQSTEATGLDPQLVPAFSRSRRSPLMYNQLVRFDADMNSVPELAESWDVSKDGLTWTFKLRQGVKFHDGQELTSADVKFTFDRLVEKSPGKGDFVTVDKIEPTGKYGIKFVTKEPFAGLLAALGSFWGFIKVGITAEIENVEYAIWIKRWLAKDFDLTMNTLPGFADPDTAFFRALHSTKGLNWNSWSVPELDTLLEEGRRTMDGKKRKDIYDRVQIMILENVPHLWLFSADTIDFTQSYVKGFKQHPTTLLYGFEGAWLDKG